MPDPRPFLWASTAFFAAAVLWLVAVALDASVPLAVAPAWLVLAGGALTGWLGTAGWYAAPFAKREPAPAWLAFAPVVLAALGLAALVASAWAPRGVPVTRVFLWASAAAWVTAAGVLLVPAFAGRAWRGGVPAWRKDGPYRRADRIAAVCALSATLHLVLAAFALVLFPVRGPGGAALVLLGIGFAAQGHAAFALHLLPRNAKRPLTAAGSGVAWGAWLTGNAGVLLLAWSLLRPLDGPPLPLGAALAAVALVALGAFLVVEPFLVRSEHPGPLVRASRPWYAAAGIAFALAGIVLGVVLSRVGILAAIVPTALAVAVGAVALAHAALAVLAWPVMLNATPRGAAWSRAGALAGVLAAPLVAAGAFVDGAGAAGAGLAVLAFAVHVVQVAPMRTPRRDCPPSR